MGILIITDINLGNFNILNLDCIVEHETRIGDYITLNPRVNNSGNVVIEDCLNFGTETQLIPGVCIGVGFTIGSGTVVTKEVPVNCLAKVFLQER